MSRAGIAMTSYFLPSESKVGAGYQMHRLAQALVRHGHAVTMFSPCTRPDDAEYAHVHLPVTGRGRSAKWLRQLQQLELDDFDVLHGGGDLLGPKRGRPPRVITLFGSCVAEALHVRGLGGRARMAALGIGELVTSATADQPVCISANTRRWFPWVRAVIPCGVDLDRFSPGGVRSPRPAILFVGTYEHRKRGRLLMEVFARQVRPALPDAELWMVCSDAPAAPGVLVLGRVSDAELADLYRRAWVFCLPSSYEAFGVPYVEAMAAGLPVVATPNPGALELTERGRFGAIASPETLGAALVDLLHDEARRGALASAGLQKAAEYSWPRIADAYSRLYERLLASRRRTRTGS
jgi:glycosyltransferase involved in cell wall biosynthesis